VRVKNFEVDKSGRSVRIWGEAIKWADQDDGSMIVECVASSEAVDLQDEVIDFEAAKSAFGAWRGNVREQHNAQKPVGKGVGISFDDAAKSVTVTAMISAGRQDTQAMIRDGTLTGFSLRAPILKRAAEVAKMADGGQKAVSRIYIGPLQELSVVDVPCNPDCSGLTVIKSFGGADMAGEALKMYLGEEVWDAQRAMSALDTIVCLYGKESAEEGESPDQVAALRDVIQRLKDFITSELAEDSGAGIKPAAAGAAAVAELAAGDPPGTEMASKAGARFSAATKAALRVADEALMSASKALQALGYDAADDGEGEGEAEKAADAGEVAEKAAPAVAALQADLAAAQARIRELEAMPAAPKGAAIAVHVAEKGADAGQRSTPEMPQVQPDMSMDERRRILAQQIAYSRAHASYRN
jgi:hypothetical protein